ncbi:group II intron maturase-specific domain-containing protein [Sinorhizobium meliloti]|uniref:group II intron maturase-specific domain-containing protein n=1 Tax=Rhizobium meliloti TaxID=382 RepID=UPI001F3DAB05|nr:group II intron maturase-specific domain-containing protein [Sinorhizobium meliloti]
MVSGTQEDAIAEKSALAAYLHRTTGLELSPEKTKVTRMTGGFEFLGFRFGMHWDERYGYGPRVEIPKTKVVSLRRRVKQLTGRDSTSVSLGDKLREINPILRGWANYYRHCVGAGRVFVGIDWYVGLRLFCWLGKKRPKAGVRQLWGSKQPSSRRPIRRLWREGPVEQHMLGWPPVCRYRLAWMGTPDFAMSSGEPDA